MWWFRIKSFLRRILLLNPEFLCDTCRYDYGDVCRRPERPNALHCPDYKKRS